jgi:hypothetical protein
MNLFKTYLVILVALANFSCQIEDADYNETNPTILMEDLKTTSDSSGLVVPFEYNVDLLDTGKNNLIVKVEYNHETISKNIELSSNMTSPEITFGSWSQVFTTGSGLLASSTVEITKDPSYTIEYVIFNYKDNSWINAEYVSANNYAIDLVNPDIGEQ